MLKILYGIYGNTIDVTDICFNELISNDIITITCSDVDRILHFTYPSPSIKKFVFVITCDIIYEYGTNDIIKINKNTNKISIDNKIKILYGNYLNKINVTDICFNNLINNNIITIPSSNTDRNTHFQDPFVAVKKSVFVVIDDITREFEENCIVKINTNNNEIVKEITPQLLYGYNTNIENTFKILYGVYGNIVDVTSCCLSELTNNNIVTIPYGDNNRDTCFQSKYFGVKKSIFIVCNGSICEYGSNYVVKINSEDYTITSKLIFKILYGVIGNKFDVTDIYLSQMNSDKIFISHGGNLCGTVKLPLILSNVKKYIFIVKDDIVYEYSSMYNIIIDKNNFNISAQATQLKILYGAYGNTIDITETCISQLNNFLNIITIPHKDRRNLYFSDPSPGIKKYVFIITDGLIYEYDENYIIRIHLQDNNIKVNSTMII